MRDVFVLLTAPSAEDCLSAASVPQQQPHAIDRRRRNRTPAGAATAPHCFSASAMNSCSFSRRNAASCRQRRASYGLRCMESCCSFSRGSINHAAEKGSTVRGSLGRGGGGRQSGPAQERLTLQWRHSSVLGSKLCSRVGLATGGCSNRARTTMPRSCALTTVLASASTQDPGDVSPTSSPAFKVVCPSSL